jgi:hypothetical protein
MATGKVSGKTEEELRGLRADHASRPRGDLYDFEDWYCLAKIPRQPEDYDGPPRYCVSTRLDPDSKRCKYHGGAGHGNPQYLDPLANMKHGMNAARENLLKDMKKPGNEWQVELYDHIVEDWPEAYDIDVSEDPLAEYEFHALATEIVRNERTAGYIIREGENGQKRIFGPNGEVEFEDVPHYLADMLQRNRKLVMRMEDNLGISRKRRMADENAQDATEAFKSFAEVGASLINDGETEYDPDRFGPDTEPDA